MMVEYVTRAVVLEKKIWRECDGVIYFFTEDWGLIKARARGIKKITSKLSGHLEPGDLVLVRLVEGKGTWVVDALKEREIKIGLPSLQVVRFLASLWQRDDDVFGKLLKGGVLEKDFLSHFGFNHRFSKCQVCGHSKPDFFELENHDFVCRICSPSLKIEPDKVICI